MAGDKNLGSELSECVSAKRDEMNMIVNGRHKTLWYAKCPGPERQRFPTAVFKLQPAFVDFQIQCSPGWN